MSPELGQHRIVTAKRSDRFMEHAFEISSEHQFEQKSKHSAHDQSLRRGNRFSSRIDHNPESIKTRIDDNAELMTTPN